MELSARQFSEFTYTFIFYTERDIIIVDNENLFNGFVEQDNLCGDLCP